MVDLLARGERLEDAVEQMPLVPPSDVRDHPSDRRILKLGIRCNLRDEVRTVLALGTKQH